MLICLTQMALNVDFSDPMEKPYRDDLEQLSKQLAADTRARPHPRLRYRSRAGPLDSRYAYRCVLERGRLVVAGLRGPTRVAPSQRKHALSVTVFRTAGCGRRTRRGIALRGRPSSRCSPPSLLASRGRRFD